MALKPTIYKFNIALSDLNHNHFIQIPLTVALHPSETLERMTTRLMAFCLHSYDDPEQLMTFTKGLSSVEEPDIWRKGLDDQLQLWLDVGEPNFDRLKKAERLAKQTWVYTFNTKSPVWWKQNQPQLSTLGITIARFNWPEIQQLAAQIERTMDWSITLSDDSAFVATQREQVELNWQYLQRLDD